MSRELTIFAFGIPACICWLVGTVSMFVMVANRKPGVPLFPNIFESPVNVAFRPALLTNRGLVARRLFFGGIAGFLICGATAFLVGPWLMNP